MNDIKMLKPTNINVDKNINNMVNAFDKIYIKSIKNLENYAQYILRCMHRVNVPVYPEDIGFATFERKNGTIAQAVFYPISSAVDGKGVVNPAFFYGFKFEYDLKDLDLPFKVVFSENVGDLIE